MADRKEHHDTTHIQRGRQRQRDIMPGGVKYVVGNSVTTKRRIKRESFLEKSPEQWQRRSEPENSNILPDGFNFRWL